MYMREKLLKSGKIKIYNVIAINLIQISYILAYFFATKFIKIKEACKREMELFSAIK